MDGNRGAENETATYPEPEFQAFTIKTTEGRAQASEATGRILGNSWRLESYGGRSNAFEVLPEGDGRLTPGQAWDLTYRLRTQRGISSAEPVFKAWITDRPDWQVGVQFEGGGTEPSPLSGLGGQLCGPGPDLVEARDSEWSLAMTNVLSAWENHFAGPEDPGTGVVIGHPDTGYRRHPEIARNLLVRLGYDLFRDDPDPEDQLDRTFPWQTPGHGTHTASVIVSPRGPAKQGSPTFVSGVAPGARLIPFRVADTVVVLDTLNLARAIEMAADAGAHVISISMGGLGSERLHDAVIYAQNKGAIVLAAAGNCVGFVVAPAAYEEVVAVAACDAGADIWRGSSRGAAVDVTAPGDRVWNALTDHDDTLTAAGQGSGTSYAVATVAGIAALWLARHGRGTIIQACGGPEKIAPAFMQVLRTTAAPVPHWPAGQFGGGLVDADALLAAPLPDGDVTPLLAPTAQEYAAVDRGGTATFAHLFESTLAVSRNAASTVGGQLPHPDETLYERLADLLHTSPDKLPVDVRQIGQELAFHLGTTPSLHRLFADTMRAAVPAADGDVTLDLTSLQGRVDEVRHFLLGKGVSQALAAKLRKDRSSRTDRASTMTSSQKQQRVRTEKAPHPDLEALARRLASAEIETGIEATGELARPGIVPDTPGSSAAPRSVPPIDADDPRLRADLITALVKAVGPVGIALLNAVDSQQRDAGQAIERDIERRTRGLTAILGALLPRIVESLPDVVSALTGQGGVPQEAEDAYERWLVPLLTALAPSVLDAVPGIVQQMTGPRRVPPPPPGTAGPRGLTVPITLASPETGVRFGSAALGGLFSGLVQALPDVIGAFADQQVQEVQLNWINFTGQRFPAGDVIALYESPLDDPDAIEFELHQPYNTWWKGMEVFVGDTMIQSLYVQDGQRDAGPVRININELVGAGSLIFSKAAFLGIHTRFYVIGGLDQKRGRRLSFVWLDD